MASRHTAGSVFVTKIFQILRKPAGYACLIGAIICLAAGPTAAQGIPDETAGYEELTRGPVHEAFAEQVSLEPEPGIIVSEAPPEPIEELPPENRPADASAVWIGGYWAYNEATEDAADADLTKDEFIWVSGGWRIPPRGSDWVPGYWTKAEKGFQWVGGFWTAAERAEVTYLPEPPATLDEGPTSAAPSDSHYWIPGCWYYRNADYVWRPGYWAAYQPGYVWIPNYYRWTPGGYVLCGGYYDYDLTSRGYLFAPVHFHSPLYTRSNWFYRPNVVLDMGPLHFHLFVRPNYCHYYFGDYYGDRFARRGFCPWHSYYSRRHAYDPLFVFNVTRYRTRGIDFHDRVKQWHGWYDKHEDWRPRHTFAEQRRFEEQHRDRDDFKTAFIANSFNDVVRQRGDKFSRFDLDDDRRRGEFDDLRERYTNMRQQRKRAEQLADADRPGDARDRRGDAGDRDSDDNAGQRRRSFDLGQFRRDDRSGGSDQFRGSDRVESLRSDIDRGDRGGRDGLLQPRVDVTPREREDRAETPSRNTGDDIRERIRQGLGDRDGRGIVPRDSEGQPRIVNPREQQPRGDQPRFEQPRTEQPRTERPNIGQTDAGQPTRPTPTPSVTPAPEVNDQLRQRSDGQEQGTNRQRGGDPSFSRPNFARPEIDGRRDPVPGGTNRDNNTIRGPAIDRRPTGENSGQNLFRPQPTERGPAIDRRPQGANSGQNLFRPQPSERGPSIDRRPQGVNSGQNLTRPQPSQPSQRGGSAFRGNDSGNPPAASISPRGQSNAQGNSGRSSRGSGNSSFRSQGGGSSKGSGSSKGNKKD